MNDISLCYLYINSTIPKIEIGPLLLAFAGFWTSEFASFERHNNTKQQPPKKFTNVALQVNWMLDWLQFILQPLSFTVDIQS